MHFQCGRFVNLLPTKNSASNESNQRPRRTREELDELESPRTVCDNLADGPPASGFYTVAVNLYRIACWASDGCANEGTQRFILVRASRE
jgi:hypothetical protein